jgi:hypothetical protein
MSPVFASAGGKTMRAFQTLSRGPAPLRRTTTAARRPWKGNFSLFFALFSVSLFFGTLDQNHSFRTRILRQSFFVVRPVCPAARAEFRCVFCEQAPHEAKSVTEETNLHNC